MTQVDTNFYSQSLLTICLKKGRFSREGIFPKSGEIFVQVQRNLHEARSTLLNSLGCKGPGI